MVSEKEKVACEISPEEVESIRRWRDELEGRNRKTAFELLNLVMEDKITEEVAFSLLESKRD
jgi:hypothetical protein